MSDTYNSESISARMFDKACMLINSHVRQGEHPLVCISAVENILRKSNLLDDAFIQALVNDLCDMYFWHPEQTLAIDKKWHTPHVDLLKPYLKKDIEKVVVPQNVDREACFAEIEDKTPIHTLLTICMEECAELQQAISKVIRYGKSDEKHLKQLSEEMADTLICIQHLKNLFNNDESVEGIITYKLFRQVMRLRKEQKK